MFVYICIVPIGVLGWFYTPICPNSWPIFYSIILKLDFNNVQNSVLIYYFQRHWKPCLRVLCLNNYYLNVSNVHFLYVTRSHAFPLSINVKINEDAISKHLNHFETYSLTQNVCHVIEHQVELQGLLKTSLYIRADLISDCSVNAMKLGICCRYYYSSWFYEILKSRKFAIIHLKWQCYQKINIQCLFRWLQFYEVVTCDMFWHAVIIKITFCVIILALQIGTVHILFVIQSNLLMWSPLLSSHLY